ncbi:MAG: hypothetical protein IJD13_08075 [Oscillospiraceae bacterium]|nr:hypothetical protein [Oscillospiraceae bacterium]
MTRKSFMFYMDYLEPLEELNDKDFRRVITAMIRLAMDDPTEELKGRAKVAFGFIRPQMQRDFEKYEERCRKNQENARKGGVARAQLMAADRQRLAAMAADTDTKTDTETDTKTDTKAKAEAKTAAKTETDAEKETAACADASMAPPEGFEELWFDDIPLPGDENVPPEPELPLPVTQEESFSLAEEREPAFTRPTLQQVRDYCRERNSPVDPGRFYHYYSARNWCTGGSEIRDWRAALRSWEDKERRPLPPKRETSYDGAAFDALWLELPPETAEPFYTAT